jgi:predicted phage-related endonuclease
MPLIEGVEQQTPDWLHMRCGIVTASRMSDVMSRLKVKSKNGDKGAPSGKRLQYRKELVYETLTGRSWERFVSPFMDYGTENEPLARAAYEIRNDVEVVPGGFWLHDRIARLGASPDGLVGEDGLVEYKVPPSRHLDILYSRDIPEEYLWQMQTEMACTGRKWCDFVSHEPSLPKSVNTWIKRVPRNDELIAAIEAETLQFLEEVVAMIHSLEA